MPIRRRIPRREPTLQERIADQIGRARSVLIAAAMVVTLGVLIEALTSAPDGDATVPAPVPRRQPAPTDGGYEMLTTSWSVDAAPDDAGDGDGQEHIDGNSPIALERRRQQELAEEARERWQNLDIFVRRPR